MWLMGLVLITSLGMGMTQEQPSEMRLKSLTIVDAEGKDRIGMN